MDVYPMVYASYPPTLVQEYYSSISRDPMNDFEFTQTQDWFSGNIPHWRSIISTIKTPSPRALEIGSWEGRSAVFLLQELCGESGSIVCIDHFDLMKTPAGRERYARIVHNLTLTGKRYRILDEFSVPGLITILQEETVSNDPGFDWIYIDGSHEADDTFLDGELAWRLAKQGAIIVFDDYRWGREPEDSQHHPKRGIDGFLALHRGEYEVVSGTEPSHYQMIVRKTTPMRIGFEWKGRKPAETSETLEYGMHVALTVDSAYAVPASVVLLGLAKSTPGRCTIHIVDCGLTAGDREKMSASVADRHDITLNFHQLPSGSLAHTMGATWGKIDLISFLPVERVLYLDGDVLLRGSVADLWALDLEGMPIGAAPDIGNPVGHEGVGSGSYFNAGVLLVDMAKARLGLDALRTLAETMRSSTYKDQDALNVHFRGRWKQLSLRWNAQGLGTYAGDVAPGRQALPLHELVDPSIVHFTGPLRPPMGVVLNPWVQPYTAKPWGYAGAPGHPYAEEWWAAVDSTAFKGWRTSEEYVAACERGQLEALSAGKADLDERTRAARALTSSHERRD